MSSNTVIYAVAALVLAIGVFDQPARLKSPHKDREAQQKVWLKGAELHFGERCSIRFMRTLRIPDDGKDYPLPPGLGEFPIYRVEDYADRVPASWRRDGGYFIPMYQAEAMWLSFDAAHWKPNVIKIAVGNVNVLDGKAWDLALRASPQNYLVAPEQPWLDGIKAGEGFIRQFVAMPLGKGYTVEAQVTGREDVGGMKIAVYEPKPGRFPDVPPALTRRNSGDMYMAAAPMSAKSAEMGLGAGGRMTQKVYEDRHGLDTWEEASPAVAVIHIVNSAMFREITGMEPPATPVDAKTYTRYGYPWFALYDEHLHDIDPTSTLRGVKSIGQIAAEKGDTSITKDSSFTVPDSQVVKYKEWKK